MTAVAANVLQGLPYVLRSIESAEAISPRGVIAQQDLTLQK